MVKLIQGEGVSARQTSFPYALDSDEEEEDIEEVLDMFK